MRFNLYCADEGWNTISFVMQLVPDEVNSYTGHLLLQLGRWGMELWVYYIHA